MVNEEAAPEVCGRRRPAAFTHSHLASEADDQAPDLWSISVNNGLSTSAPAPQVEMIGS